MGSIRGSSYYTIVSGPTWTQAEANSVALGGHLATINEQSERDWLELTFQTFRRDHWIGLNDSKQEGNWEWASGETGGYVKWNPGSQPSNWGDYSERDYATLSGTQGGYNHYYNDTTAERLDGIAEIPLSYFSISDLTLTEGASGNVTISRTGGTLSTQTLNLISSNGTATAGSDYTAISTSVSFAAGETSKTISISTIDDTTAESSETFNLTLTASTSDAVPAQISDGTALVTITDNDPTAAITVNGNNNGIANAGTIPNSGTINTDAQVTNITNNTFTTYNNVTNTTVNNSYVYYNSNNTTNNTWNTLLIDNSVKVRDVITQWFPTSQPIPQSRTITDTKFLDIAASTWSGKVQLVGVAQAATSGSRLDAPQVDFNAASNQGAMLNGDVGNDELWGKAGWDIFDGGAGNDLIRAGNGRDILTGGIGRDELHGDFGWNTYKAEKDGFSDLIAIKSDQFLTNWLYGKAGNNPDGEKADIIEGLDAIDQIKIIGVDTRDITVRAGATAHGVSGIGIYARGALEGLYVGGDLSVNQIAAMTSGDGSAAALNNQVSSYGWTGV